MIAPPRVLHLAHGDLPLPALLPDATRGVVRSIDAADLEACGVAAVVMNTYHLMQRPGSSTIRALGGLHAMTGWRRPIMTDSGGFQIYSLIRQNSRLGTLGDRGATFTPDGERRFTLTPEKSIQLQLGYGADILVCLDDCTHADDSPGEQLRSVRRTVDWARRSKATLDRLLGETRPAGPDRPLLFAVIQGGADPDLRRRCAEELLEIGFDGYGYGGWPLDGRGNLLTDMLALTRELVPRAVPLHALGIGHPANVAACVRMGYPLFDSAMPTRDARNGRLYAFTTDDPAAIGRGDGWFEYVHPGDLRHVKAAVPVSSRCDCHTCATYSLGYLHHLFKLGDGLYARLATIHNLRFMTRLMECLGAERTSRAGRYAADAAAVEVGERPRDAPPAIRSTGAGAPPQRSAVPAARSGRRTSALRRAVRSGARPADGRSAGLPAVRLRPAGPRPADRRHGARDATRRARLPPERCGGSCTRRRGRTWTRSRPSTHGWTTFAREPGTARSCGRPAGSSSRPTRRPASDCRSSNGSSSRRSTGWRRSTPCST